MFKSLNKIKKYWFKDAEYFWLLLYFLLCGIYLVWAFCYIIMNNIYKFIPPEVTDSTNIIYCNKHNRLAVKKYNIIDLSYSENKCFCNNKKPYYHVYESTDKKFQLFKLKYDLCKHVLNLKPDDISKFFIWYEKNKDKDVYIMTKDKTIYNILITSTEPIDLKQVKKSDVYVSSYKTVLKQPVLLEEIENGKYIGRRTDSHTFTLKKVDHAYYYALTITNYYF